ncbi:MAG: hypothetical protein Q8R28_15145 [Dehalococcoidia bacterium]|nr:hypothetical protein [Dehalococcoidia bacterium]
MARMDGIKQAVVDAVQNKMRELEGYEHPSFGDEVLTTYTVDGLNTELRLRTRGGPRHFNVKVSEVY